MSEQAKKIDDGGAAFPTLGDEFIQTPSGGFETKSAYGMQGEKGMNLRDYFAALAMQAFLSHTGLQKFDPTTAPRWGSPCATQAEDLAERAYLAADAMIAARKANGAA